MVKRDCKWDHDISIININIINVYIHKSILFDSLIR